MREQGADARRLLPMLCRRGNIRGSDIGSIELRPNFSLVEVATRVAADFERATRRSDPRDPGVFVRREPNPLNRDGSRPPARDRSSSGRTFQPSRRSAPSSSLSAKPTRSPTT